MAVVNKDFKVKNGLIVEGTTATVDNFDILTKKTDDQNYIVNLIGGTATSANEANKVVKRDANGDFAAGEITADLVGDVTGDVTGTVSDISNHNTDGLSEGQNNLYFETYRATDAVAAELGTGIVYGSQGAGNVFHVDEMLIATRDYADDAAGTAQTNAESYADTVSGNALTSANAYADTAAAGAVTTANAYTDGRETAITTAYEAYADQAEVDAKAYTDQEVAALVNGAPELLDTLNELAAAIGDDENFAANLATSVGTKVSKAGDTMTGLLVLSADPSENLGAATKQYVDAAEADANAYADQAEVDAKAYTDTREGAITTAYQSYADTAEADAKAYADGLASTINGTIAALDTDDVAEGSNLYYTAARAKAEAATLLANATKTNIVITKDASDNLTITAENGVADSDTDDLAEGSTNLYFTNARAVTALEAVTPDFPAVEIANIAKQVAAEASVETASTNTAVSWAKASYRSAEFLVKIANGSHTEVSKVILTLDTSDNVAITEYAMVGTNGSLGSVSADVSGNDVRLRVTTANNTSVVGVVGTLIK
jgi:hypothetical protein